MLINQHHTHGLEIIWIPTIIRNTVNPIKMLYFNMQSGSWRKLSSNFLSLKHIKIKERFFILFRLGSRAVILRVFLPEKILLKLH